MPKRLVEGKIREVSGVDAAANRREFLLSKAAKGADKEAPISKGVTMPKFSPGAILKALKALPGTVKKELPAEVKAMLAAADADAPHEELVDYVDDAEADETLDDLVAALGDALDDVLDSETESDKRGAVEAMLEQFMELLGASGLLKAAGILKAGRKISSTNMDLIQQIQALFGQLLTNAGAEPAPNTDPNADPNGAPNGEGSNPEDDPAPNALKEEMEMARKARLAKREARKAEKEKKTKEKKEKDMTKSVEFIALEKRQAATEADLKKERDIRLNGEFLQKAKDIGPVPGTTFEKSAALLKSLYETNPEQAKQVEEQMKASAAIAKNSALFTEIGKGAQGGATDPASLMIAKASEIQKRDSISLADAMTKAAKEDPGMYADYVNASRKGN